MTDTDHKTFGEALAAHAAERGDQVAIRFGDRATDYATLESQVNRVANGLTSEGIGPGDRVAYLGKNSDRAVALTLACGRVGAVFVPIIWRLGPSEIAYILEDAGATMLFVEPEFDAAPFDGPRIAMDDSFDSWRDEQDAADPDVEVTGADPFLQLYTSGTTGRPKGVVLSHRNGTNMRVRLREEGIYWYAADPGDSVILAMPYGHIAGVGTATGAVLAGQELIVHAEFDPALTIADVARYRVKWLFLVPAALRIMLAHPAAENADFSSVRGLTYGASPIPLDLLREGVERLGCGFAQLYGLTETWGTVVSLAPEDHGPGREAVMRSAGKALPGIELRILDEEGRSLPTGQTGEVAIRGESVMLGYHGKPEETARVLDADGWFRSGDAGMLDEDGYLFIQDRIKDMIITGGENVYPAEVESTLYGHPDISDVAVIGVPDEKWGEAVKAVVVAKPGTDLTEASVIGYAKERIAGFKAPKSVDFIDELPRNPSGKILRRSLREPYWQGRERAVN